MSVSTVNSCQAKTVAVIGGGPAGLMAAEVLSRQGIQVDVYDAMPSVGRKFLMAGKGGMNISHSEPFGQFLSRYGDRQQHLKPFLTQFGPEALVEWLKDLGIATFIGSSGRIFPVDMKAAPLLRSWLHRLRQRGVKFHVRHCWTGWADTQPDSLRFTIPTGELVINPDAVILALGGASWPQLGSTGSWVPLLVERGIAIAPLQPANCGFETPWSAYFQKHYAGCPLKPVQLEFSDSSQTFRQRGELIITEHGLEGGLIYALSGPLRQELQAKGAALLTLDLLPDLNLEVLTQRLRKPRGKQSFSNHLRKCAGLDGVKTGLLREVLSSADFDNLEGVAHTIKALPIKLTGTRPLAEAISTAGGICFTELTPELMLSKLPGWFCAGEMLDWDAPTGGYLLTACFASGHAAAQGLLNWWQARDLADSGGQSAL